MTQGEHLEYSGRAAIQKKPRDVRDASLAQRFESVADVHSTLGKRLIEQTDRIAKQFHVTRVVFLNHCPGVRRNHARASWGNVQIGSIGVISNSPAEDGF